MPGWDQPFISMLVSQVGKPYSPKVGMTLHFLNTAHDCMLNQRWLHQAHSGIDWIGWTIFDSHQVVAWNIGDLAPPTFMKTVPIIGTTLGCITTVHVYNMFCAVDPYLSNYPDGSWLSIDFRSILLVHVHIFVEVGKEEFGDEPFILPPRYLFGCLVSTSYRSFRPVRPRQTSVEASRLASCWQLTSVDRFEIFWAYTGRVVVLVTRWRLGWVHGFVCHSGFLCPFWLFICWYPHLSYLWLLPTCHLAGWIALPILVYELSKTVLGYVWVMERWYAM